MVILVIGSPSSGKSERAENLLLRLAERDRGEKIYIATMVPYGEEGALRVERHRKLREGKNFRTIECPDTVSRLVSGENRLMDANCLLECMSNLIGNEMYLPDNQTIGDDELEEKIICEVGLLAKHSRNLVIVTNRFAKWEEGYDEATIRYVSLVERINERLRDMADRVDEIRNGEWEIYENH